MYRRLISVATPAVILAALLAGPTVAMAQRHGGGGHGEPGGSSLSSYGRPDGVDEKDTLKDFHRALAVQATSQQVAEYQALMRNTDAAKADLEALRQLLGKENNTADLASRDAAVDQALENVRSGTRKFVDGFSTSQKSGLKEITKRLSKADSDLEQEEKKLDGSFADAKAVSPDAAAHTESLDKVLDDFYNEQLALGREMSIVLANGQDLAFTLPQVKSPVKIENQTIGVTVSGVLLQTAASGGQRTFKVELIADLSDLQQNITPLLRAELDSSELCGQRLAIRQASLTPSTPRSLLVMRLHFERWTCTRMYGQQTTNELAEGDGSVEMKLTAAVGESNRLKVVAEFGRIDASGMLAESLRSGSLGDDLRDKVSALVLSAMQGLDFNTALPPAAQNSAMVQSAKFQDAGVGNLNITLEGQIQISYEQADQLASQLNQALSAQGTSPR